MKPAAVVPTSWGSDPEFLGPRHAVREAMLARRFQAVCPPPARVLDAGCGAGLLARRLAGIGYEVAGVDASPACIAHARQAAGAGMGGPAFAVGDLTALPFPDASFAGAVAGEVLEHVTRDDQAAAELFRVIAPGGWLVATVPADPALWDASDDWAGHLRRYDEASLRALLGGAGFEVRELVRWGFPTVRLYHRWLFLPLLRRKLARPEQGPSAPLGGWRRQVSRVIAWAMAADALFDGSPWGIGWLVVAHKPGAAAR